MENPSSGDRYRREPSDGILPVLPIVSMPGETQVGYVVRRSGYRGEELYCEVRYQNIPMLLPCRRVNRVTDPYGVYVLADGSLWRSAWPETAIAGRDVWAGIMSRSAGA